MDLTEFGNTEIDVKHIIGIAWAWKQGTVINPVTGLTTMGDTEELLNVTVFLDTSQMLQMSGKDARAFREWHQTP